MPFFSQPGKFEKLQSVSQTQEQAIMSMLQQALGQLQNPTQGFEPIAQDATRRFNQQTVPGIAERFASMGENRPTSGAFASQLGSAGADLQSSLAAQQAQYGQRQQGLAQQLAQLGLSPTFQYAYHAPQEGAASKIGSMIAQAGGAALGTYMGGGGNPLQTIMSMFGGGQGQQPQQGGMMPQMNPMAQQLNNRLGMANQAFAPNAPNSYSNLQLLQGGF